MTGSWLIVNNEDAGNYAYLDVDDPVESLRQYVNWAADRLPFTVWEIQAATPDVCFCATRAGERAGARVMPEIVRYMEQEGGKEYRTGPGRPADGKFIHHIAYYVERLAREGHDVLELQAEELRKRGIKVVAEMRMSDTHHYLPDLDNPLVSQFQVDHPEYVIKRADGSPETALDYGHAEVRAHRLAIARDLVESRDIDGLSLNFNRWAKHFARDFGEANAPIMTEFVAQVRAILDEVAGKRGSPRMLLSARFVSRTDESLRNGIDAGAMMKRGLLDYVVVSTHNNSWPGLQVEEFVALAEGTGCKVLGAMGDLCGGGWGEPAELMRGPGQWPGRPGYSGMLTTVEEARGIAANLKAWGAQGIGFWNLPCNMNPFNGQGHGTDPKQVERMIEWTNAVATEEGLQATPRRYHYIPLYERDFAGVVRNYAYSENGRSPQGAFEGTVLYFNEGRRDQRQAFGFRMADGRGGQKLTGTLKFRVFHCGDNDAIDVDVNGAAVATDNVRRTPDNGQGSLSWSWFELDLAGCPPFRGDNELGLTWRGAINRGLIVPYMEELDIIVTGSAG